MKLQVGKTALVIIDVQERLAPAMAPEQYEPLVRNLERFGAARQALELPVVITEQYPKGLGPTVEPLRKAYEGINRLPKVTFSGMADEAIASAIAQTGAEQVVIAGMETHICVYQTARDLAEKYKVHVLTDAVASRTQKNYEIGLGLIEASGGLLTSTEVVLFDLLGRAGGDAFKLVSKLIR